MMHYHIDAWIWAITKQLKTCAPEEQPETRKFLDYRIKQKQEGLTFFGVTLGSATALAPDMVELIGLLDEWTKIYQTGRDDYERDLPRKLKIEGKVIITKEALQSFESDRERLYGLDSSW